LERVVSVLKELSIVSSYSTETGRRILSPGTSSINNKFIRTAAKKTKTEPLNLHEEKKLTNEI